MTTAERLCAIYAKHGKSLSPARADRVIAVLREQFGVLFSAADVDWDEDSILDRVDALLSEAQDPEAAQ